MANLNWEDIRSILAVVQLGSLSKAGMHLGVNYTTVSRRIQRAEDALGHPLFERHPEGYVPLPEAHEIAHTAERMEHEEFSLMRRLAGKQSALSGSLTFTAPQLLIQSHLAPVLAEFTSRYPEIDLKVKASYDILDLSRREADLALRISHEPQGHLIGRRLCDQRSAFFGTPEISQAAAFDHKAQVEWLLFIHQDTVPEIVQTVHPNVRIRARLDDMGSLMAAAQAGMGVLRMPLFLEAACAGLVRLPHLPLTPYAPVWLLNHEDLQQSPKVNALKEMLVAWFRQNSHVFQGNSATAVGL
ncbi:transcriptional regulator, LysR family [Epibacterium ulvae]|uniref:Transcriptional regulator, LysR family n=1 Tax=Epibacterium ulvae TaxID=1156985 RepID=A0A1G5R5J5_9RHOB|nr:LysR family transcriptional regulator [Epibacterium ulvae]SCZ69090.1 transcriptional regulator, LysR family [Epibacterium ulvae]